MEIIELNSDSRKRKTHKFKWKDWIDCGYISILLILVIFALLFSTGSLASKDMDNYKLVLYKYQNQRNNSNTNNGNNSLDNSKMSIAFYYPTLTKFMISTAQFLIKTGKCNIVF